MMGRPRFPYSVCVSYRDIKKGASTRRNSATVDFLHVDPRNVVFGGHEG